MTTPSDDRAAPSAAARDELLAARSLLDDPVAPDRTASIHLLRAWAALAGVPPTQLGTWARAPDADETPGVAASDKAQLLEDLPSLEGDAAPKRATLRRQLRALERVLRETPTPGRPRFRPWPRLAIGLVLIGAVLIYAELQGAAPGSGPWRAEYYPRPDFEGVPTIQRDQEVDFDWGYRVIHPELPKDRVTARWDTCLLLDESVNAAFHLTSDDGSRVFVDGELLVDNWGKHRMRARGEFKKLDPGIHHLRVEYMEHTKNAQMHLAVSFDEDEPPDGLPADLLRYPGDDLDENDPCGKVSP